jgi:hypothetical protein
MKKLITTTAFILAALAGAAAHAELPTTRADGVTVVHLDEYNGYFSAEETLASLKTGSYEFVVTNRSDKLVGFQIQNYDSHKTLDMFPLEPGESRVSRVAVTEDGVRYRCPINPTPWYDLDVIK